MSVVVVGLGPAGADLVTPRARQALESADVRLARTVRHPAIDELGLEFEGLDHHYEVAADLDAAYDAIATDVAERAVGADVAYAVPGNPAVGERTVALLRERGVAVTIVPGLSFAELAWAKVGVDPLGVGRVLDGRRLEREALLLGGPVLIGQVDAPAVASEVKLALLDGLPAAHPVTLLQRLGLPDEQVSVVSLADLDRAFEPDHLTALFVDLGPSAGGEFARFVELIETLRGPGGCPWDAEQTHHSLTRHLVEEAYEVIEALEALPPGAPQEPVAPEAYARVEDELGDLTAQVVFHATLAREAGAFTVADVLRGIREKLVRRHPHVFGDVEAGTADAVMRNWEQIKAEERRDDAGRASLVADVPTALPALLYAHKLLRKAASAGLEPMSTEEAATRIAETAARLPEASDGEATTLVGDLLAAVTHVARSRGFDAESALRGWAARFREHFLAVEALAADRGLDLTELTPDHVAALWIEAAGPA